VKAATAPLVQWLGAERWRERLPGLAAAAVLAFFASALAGGLGDPLARNPLLVAMLLGLAVGNAFGCPERLRPGLDFTKRFVLRFAVVLVGFRITARLLSDLGAVPVAIAGAELVIVFAAVYWAAHKLLALDRELALLLAAGHSVCGASAVLSVAGVTGARPQQAAIAVTVITLFGTLALIGLPYGLIEGYLPGFDDERYGVFVGASVYEVPQVVGAAHAVSELALYTATLVKLTKVLMLVPMLFLLIVLRRRASRAVSAATLPFPWFVLGFVGVMLFNSMVSLPGPVKARIQEVDLFFFLMVMIALGLDTRIARLKEEGGAARLVAVGVLALAFSSSLTYLLVKFAAPAPASAAQQYAALGAALDTEGGRLFYSTGCEKCHVASLPAGDRRVLLYSDLLLHDMGPELDDKIVQGEATGRDWRTAPLIGLGLRTRYLHDGRAATLREAVLAHGGEGEIVRERFLGLSEAEQEALYLFLRRL